jgi:DNA mismatch repair protein MutS2
LLEASADVEASLDRIADAQRLRAEGYRLPLDAVTDVRDTAARAAKGALLEPRELIQVAQTLLALAHAREGLLLREAAVPGLMSWAQKLPSLEPLATRLDRAFEASGGISDRASQALREARERARALHRTIKGKLETLLRDESFVPHLREHYYSVRNERYVLPVLAQDREEVPGIVHNASQSGQTLFVEPQALVGLGNDLAIAQSLVLEEERQVLLELSDGVGRVAETIQAGVDASALLDEAEAAASLSEELGATRPELGLPGDGLRLVALRHPLLVLSGRPVVANDVELAGRVRALVVSGPNAGGKTVTLTAVGLSVLMLRLGLPIPAGEGSRLPLYPSIHAAVGDAQSLSEGLSTFSAHLAELRDIQQHVGPGSLVLIDEIAADTDPQEGAALASAVLEDLLDQGASLFVTTHLEELKALAHIDPRFANARVGFDSRRMAPTYRLQMGEAGSSSAIALAERMGLSAKVCAQARSRLRESGGPLAQALRALEEDRQRLGHEIAGAESLRKSLEQERDGLAQDLTRVRQSVEQEAAAKRQTLQAELERALAEVRNRVAALREETSLAQAETTQAELRGELRTLEQTRREEEARAAPPVPETLRPGMWVRHVGFGRDVEVLEVKGDEVQVAAGPLKIRVPRDQLAGAQGSRAAIAFKPTQLTIRAQAAAPAPMEVGLPKCDLRGMRADDAVREVTTFLDRVLRAGEPTALIVHGHGTGALKTVVRESLESSPYVESFRPGASLEGGDGVTVVTLRG